MTNGGYKPGFNYQDRTIRPPVPDGTRVRAIQIRLFEINQVRMTTFELPEDLKGEKIALENEYYEIERAKWIKFQEGL